MTEQPARVTPDDLAQAGRLLHGDLWQSPLARDLGVSERTMRYWIAAEDRQPPAGIRADLVKLLKKRSADAAKFAAALEKAS
jgi:DNA-binding transcriptional regulator YiaG